MLLQSVASGMTIGVPELVQFFVFAFACGGLCMAVRSHDKRLNSLEEKRESDQKAHNEAMQRIEERSIAAVESLGTSIQELNTRLEVVVATHEQRLQTLEKRED